MRTIQIKHSSIELYHTINVVYICTLYLFTTDTLHNKGQHMYTVINFETLF